MLLGVSGDGTADNLHVADALSRTPSIASTKRKRDKQGEEHRDDPEDDDDFE